VPDMNELTEPEVFVLADVALQRVVDRIAEGQWSMPMPADFARAGSDHVPTLREIVNYHAYDDAWVPDMLAGRTMEEAGTTRFDGDLLGDDPKARFAGLVDAACDAARSVPDLDAVVHCSFGDFPVRGYFWQINYFRGLRAYDLAAVIGVDAALPDELVAGLWAELEPQAEEWRSIGVLPPPLPVDPDAPLTDRLLALTGRPPAR